jgi:hypothetical protein
MKSKLLYEWLFRFYTSSTALLAPFETVSNQTMARGY